MEELRYIVIELIGAEVGGETTRDRKNVPSHLRNFHEYHAKMSNIFVFICPSSHTPAMNV